MSEYNNYSDNQQLAFAANMASKMGDIRTIINAIEAGWDINGRLNPDGDTMLTMSIMYGQTRLAIWLLDNGASANFSLRNGRTPLITAAGCGNIDVIRCLLTKGVQINHQMNNGATALMYAMAKGQVIAVRFLLAMGASSEIKDNDGWSVIDYARNIGFDEATIRALFQ